jgi:hypothetical protein
MAWTDTPRSDAAAAAVDGVDCSVDNCFGDAVADAGYCDCSDNAGATIPQLPATTIVGSGADTAAAAVGIDRDKPVVDSSRAAVVDIVVVDLGILVVAAAHRRDSTFLHRKR